MKKFWLIFVHEYQRHVLRKRFIFALLSMPIFVGFIALVGFLTVWLQFNRAPVGYISPAGILENAKAAPASSSQIFPNVDFIKYTDQNSAMDDLQSQKIQAFFVLSADYLKNGQATIFENKKSGTNIEDDFSNFLKYNLVADKPENVAKRLIQGTNLIVRSVDGSRELAANNWLAILLPIISGLLFIMAVNISGGYLLQALVEEKENRTMEIIVTSVSPTQLMAGKVIGNLLVGLTELVVWLLFAIIAIKFLPSWLPIGQSIQIDASSILLIVAIYLPAFVVIAAAMGAIGATATEAREAQQVSGIFTLPIIIPFWFITAIMFDPNGQISTILSIFPLTAPIAMPLRALFTTVPIWQVIVTVATLDLLAVLMVWFTGKIFRVGMLQYGKRLSLKEIFKASNFWAGKA
jgi:ABC-2 type transport system permease protein